MSGNIFSNEYDNKKMVTFIKLIPQYSLYLREVPNEFYIDVAS